MKPRSLFRILPLLTLLIHLGHPSQAKSASFIDRVRVSPFVAYEASQFSTLDGSFGYGLSAAYEVSKNLQIEADALTLDNGGSFIDRAGLRLVPVLPVGKTGFAIYGLIGPDALFTGHGVTRVAEHDWYLRSGGGIRFRARKNFGVGGDISLVQNFQRFFFEPRVFLELRF